MQKSVLVSVTVLAIVAGCASPDSSPPTGLSPATPSFTYELAVPGNAGDTPARVHLIRGAGRPGGGGVSPLVWHNGEVMNSAAVKAIYWGTSWGNTSYQGDKVTGLASFYSGLNNSSYMGTNTEFSGSNGTQVTKSVSYGGFVLDATPGPTRAPKVADVEAEVCKAIASPVANAYYPVYTDLKRGHNGYCAWHSYGSCGGVPVQFGFFFDLDGDPGCDPGAPYYNHSQGLAALANVSGHEISEAVTDPRNGGWWDNSGAENADKCAWTFSGLAISLGSQSWKIQGNFSNNALTAKSGYDGSGCIDR